MKHSSTKHKYHSLYTPVKVIEHNWSNNMIPMVSVVCITYNHGRFIREAIESFLMQETNFKVEILIGEDCSTDGTREIVFDYKKKYPDLVRVITSTSNVGMHANGSRTLNAVRGKYIALCEGDDYWIDPLKLQKQVDYMESHPECSLCVHSALRINKDGNNKISYKRPFINNQSLSTVDIISLIKRMFATNSFFFRFKDIKNLPEYYIQAPVGDFPLAIHLSLQGNVYYIDQCMSTYRMGSIGSWSNRMKNKQEFEKYNKRAIETLAKIDKYTNYKYSKVINERILAFEFEKLLFESDINRMKLDKYKKFYTNMSIYKKIKIYIKYWLPNIYKVYKYLNNKSL